MTGAKKIHRSEFDINIKKNPPSLRIDKEGNIPPEYFKNLAPILDKTLLKDAIKNGLNIEGVQLVQTERLEIK